jgi:hypothetical protein
MKVIGPDRYRLSFDAKTFTVSCPKGGGTFSGLATWKRPKLYIVSVDQWPIYVGVTKQPMRNRLRFGWNATGASGYYGYAWRHEFKEADLDVWSHHDAPPDNSLVDIETIEAEVVFLMRCAGQWPLFQTEIHFHPSEPVHRGIAATMIARYALKSLPIGESGHSASPDGA